MSHAAIDTHVCNPLSMLSDTRVPACEPALPIVTFHGCCRYKYIHMEEMLGNVAGARQVFERWMGWEPDHHGWAAYIKVRLSRVCWAGMSLWGCVLCVCMCVCGRGVWVWVWGCAHEGSVCVCVCV
jgi:hypothetical protein